MSRLFVKGSSKQIGRRRSAVAAALVLLLSFAAAVHRHREPSQGCVCSVIGGEPGTGEPIHRHRSKVDKDGMKALGNYLANLSGVARMAPCRR